MDGKFLKIIKIKEKTKASLINKKRHRISTERQGLCTPYLTLYFRWFEI